MRYILASLLALVLVGCGTTQPPKPEVITLTKYKYVIVSVPDDVLYVPDFIPTPDSKTATDAEIATWILDKEGRAQSMEKIINAAKKYATDRLELLRKNKEIKEEDIIR